MNTKHFKATDFLAGLYGGEPTVSNPVVVNDGLPDQVEAHSREVLAALSSDLAASEIELPTTGDPAPWENCIEPPDPCPQCGTLELWQTLAGNWRCLHCDPPKTAIRTLETAEKIRRRHGVQSPPGTAEMLATMKRLTDT